MKECQSELLPAERASGAVAVQHGAIPMSAYEAAMRLVADPACDPERVRTLLAVRREWQADEAKSAFNDAVVRFQQECPIIAKGDKAYDKMYARIDRIWRTIRPLLRECGLAVTWEGFKEVNGVCILDGHLLHRDGHSQPLHHEIPLPDQIKGMNAAQRSGAAETYAKRYAMCAALGIQTGDDDDGNCGAPAGARIDEKQRNLLTDMLVAAGRSEAFICGLAEVATIDEIPAADVKVLCNTLQKIIDGNRAKAGAKA